MKAYPTLRRWLAGVATAAILAVVVLIGALSSHSGAGDKGKPEQPVAAGKDGWLMYGGSHSRNMVNRQVKGLPTEWEVGEKGQKGKNIKWVADLGSKAYGGPIVAGGRVIVGTNNQKPRDEKWTEIDPKTKKKVPIDLGVIMCF